MVEIAKVYFVRQYSPSAIPSRLQLRVGTSHPSCEGIDFFWCCIASHEGYTSNILAVIFEHDIERHSIKRLSNIFPKVLAMTPKAVARAVRDIYRERDLIRNLLKDHARIYVFQFKNAGFSITDFVAFQAIMMLAYPASSPAAELSQAVPVCLDQHSSGVPPPSDVLQRSC